MKNNRFMLLLDGQTESRKEIVINILKSKTNNVLFTGFNTLKDQISDFENTPTQRVLVSRLIYANTRAALGSGMSICIDQEFIYKEHMTKFEEIGEEENALIYLYSIETSKYLLNNQTKLKKEHLYNINNKIDKNFNSADQTPEENAKFIYDQLPIKPKFSSS